MKADARTERELSILTRLRDRTYDDIRYFINEREKKHWRLWDHYGGHMYKPIIDPGRMSLQQIQERIDIHLQMIAFIEPRYGGLVAEIPPYNTINAEMIQFCTAFFGNEGWLQMFQLKQLRKQQD